MSRVTREVSVEQSVQTFIEAALTARGFPMPSIEMKDAFEQRDFDDAALDHEYVALGYNFDGGGSPVEIGSNRRLYSHTIEVFIVATTAPRGKALAYAIRDALEEAGRVSLVDVETGAEVDVLLIDPVSVERQAIPDPDPWEEFVWLLRVPVLDEFDPADA